MNDFNIYFEDFSANIHLWVNASEEQGCCHLYSPHSPGLEKTFIFIFTPLFFVLFIGNNN